MKNILLGVTGSVAAMKTKILVEALSTIGMVRIILTKHADYFIDSAWQQAWQHRKIMVYRSCEEWPASFKLGQTPILHIEMRRWAHCFVIAPLSAHTLAKIAHGFCDNLLTNTVRAWDWTKPLVLCPAMNTLMWNNPPTQEQLIRVTHWGANVIAPVVKTLACKDVGMGGMASIENIMNEVENKL